jgi:heme a synthase
MFDAAQERIERNVGVPDATPVAVAKNGLDPLALFAWFVVAYNIAVFLWGAYVRATGSGAGCGRNWPLCNGEILPVRAQIQTLIEFTHRVSSGLSVALVWILLIWCWRRTRKGDWARYSAVVAVVLLFSEALLGAMLVVFDHVGMDRSVSRAAFLCLHFGNTLLFVAALTLTAKWLGNVRRRLAPAASPYGWIVIGFGLVCTMATGMSGSLAALGDTVFPAATLGASIAQDFSATSHPLLRLRLLHPVVAGIAFIYLLWLVRKLASNADKSSQVIPFLTAALLAQVVLGVLNVMLLAPIWLQLTHLLVAEVFWIMLVLASIDLLFTGKHFGDVLSHQRSAAATK